MLRRVDLVWTDVKEERIAFIFRVEKSASEEPEWAGGCRLSHHSKTQPTSHAGSSLTDFSTLKMKAIRSYETSVHTRSTRSHIPDDGIFHVYLFFKVCERWNTQTFIENFRSLLQPLPTSLSLFLLPDLCPQDSHPMLTNGHYPLPGVPHLSVERIFPYTFYLRRTRPD
jgi:hypothetical protein